MPCGSMTASLPYEPPQLRSQRPTGDRKGHLGSRYDVSTTCEFISIMDGSRSRVVKYICPLRITPAQGIPLPRQRSALVTQSGGIDRVQAPRHHRSPAPSTLCWTFAAAKNGGSNIKLSALAHKVVVRKGLLHSKFILYTPSRRATRKEVCIYARCKEI
ncbi:hypothetical protein BDN72DRAFT_834788 [Pluteus cervinus]|uniref:Uncharacterized protein n=1 Tax=Pluteus cervinus TaxID=181527 RepID=A0ACD3B715_9AGAR|nr:hypothetical protein BDN72DRAFT_834788 [Pluteus cervinus]